MAHSLLRAMFLAYSSIMNHYRKCCLCVPDMCCARQQAHHTDNGMYFAFCGSLQLSFLCTRLFCISHYRGEYDGRSYLSTQLRLNHLKYSFALSIFSTLPNLSLFFIPMVIWYPGKHHNASRQ